MAKVTEAEPRRDGRNERGERTRDAVVDAMLGLIEDGDLRPTAPRVAERAGVALRTVFHHFDDMEALLSAAAERQIARHLETLPVIPADAPLDDRIEMLVASRARSLEAIAPVRRAALLWEPFSDVVASRLRAIRERGRAEVLRVFAPELARLGPADRRDAVEALTVASSWSTWEALRRHQGLSPAQARRVMKRTIAALLEHAR